MPNLECPGQSNSTAFGPSNFAKFKVTEFSSILVSGFAQNAKGAVTQSNAKARECITL